MAIPSSYTELQLQDYMLTVTKAVSDAIGLTSDLFEEATNDVLAIYGVEDIADANNVHKLRTLARVEAWRVVIDATAVEYDQSRDSGETQVWDKRNQLHTNAVKQLERAKADANEYGYLPADSVGNTITIGAIVYDDPYSITEDDSSGGF